MCGVMCYYNIIKIYVLNTVNNSFISKFRQSKGNLKNDLCTCCCHETSASYYYLFSFFGRNIITRTLLVPGINQFRLGHNDKTNTTRELAQSYRTIRCLLLHQLELEMSD